VLNPAAAAAPVKGAVRNSKMLKNTVSFDSENTQYARQACQDRIWLAQERK